MRLAVLTCVCCWLGLLAGCRPAAPVVSDGRLPVTVTIDPQAWLVRAIGGERVTVSVMVPPGVDHEAYEPKPQQMVALSQCRLYLAIGMAFEEVWLPRFKGANKQLLITRQDAGIEKLGNPGAAAEEDHAGHDHAVDDHSGHDHAGHNHGAFDPHIWLSPRLLLVQAATVRDALIAADSEHAAEYLAGFARVQADLQALASELAASLAQVAPRQTFVVYHPAWAYFAQEYGLEQVAIERDGREPRLQEMEALITRCRELKVDTLFVEPRLSSRGVEALAAALSAKLVTLDPVAADVPANLRLAAKLIGEAAR